MSSYTATIRWKRGATEAYTDGRYSRAHEWAFDGGAVVPASASPHIVPAPHSDAAGVDPEEAFVAALASCHMLFLLDFARRAGFVVDSYSDEAQGVLAKRSIYFDLDSYTVKDEFKPVLEAHARYLNANKSRQIVIQGNTDERGGREYNLALGQKRAEAVARALALLGASEAQIEPVSFGEERPAVQGSDESAWALTAEGELDTAAYGAVLRAKRPVLVRGAGPRFSGTWYVERVLHTFTPDGYTQRFALRRNALGVTGQERFAGAGIGAA